LMSCISIYLPSNTIFFGISNMSLHTNADEPFDFL